MSIQGFANRNAATGLPVIRAGDFRVSNGANLGDPVAHATEMLLDDIYNLAPAAQTWRIGIAPTADCAAPFRITEASQMGRPGAQLHLDCCATFMAPDGTIVDALVLVEIEPDSPLIAATYLMPMAELQPRVDYALVQIDHETPCEKLAHLACVSFTRGTRITMADGRQMPIEDIRAGDLVLTRDNGAQPVRWIGHQTMRATGAFAPIVFAPGTVNNEAELRLSPNQRLFFHQREDRLRAGQAEVMVKAEHLVNGDSVVRASGGFVDYYRILLDSREFLFAEGVAAESLTFDPQTSAALPQDIESRLVPGQTPAHGRPNPVELPEGLLDRRIAAAALCQVSMG